MQLFKKEIQPIIHQSLIIGGSKFIALSMPLADIVILSKMATQAQALSDYIFATQIIQIFVVLSVTASVGIPIFYNQTPDKKHAVQVCVAYAGVLGLALFVLGLFLLMCLHAYSPLSQTQYLTYVYLILGILSLPAYVVFSHILDTLGKSKYTFNATVVFALGNVILDFVLVWSTALYEQVAVSLATTIIRFLGALIFLGLLYKEFSIHHIIPKIHKKHFIKMGAFGLSEAVTSLIFVTSFALLTYFLTFRFSDIMVAQYGIALNFINTISVVYIGLAISLSIHLSKNNPHIPSPKDRYWNTVIFAFCVIFGVIALLSIPIFAWLYFGGLDIVGVVLLMLALAVAVLDGMGIAMISKLRVLGFAQYPPLLRLFLVFLGMPLGLVLLQYWGISGLLMAFVLANLLTVLGLLYWDKKIMGA